MPTSAIALGVMLYFVSPALLAYAFATFLLPRTRIQRPSDFAIVLLASFYSLLCNSTLLLELAAGLQSLVVWIGEYSPQMAEGLSEFDGYGAVRPGLWLSSKLGFNISEYNPAALIADLHIRALAIALGLILVFKSFSWIDNTLEYIPYSNEKRYAIFRWLASSPDRSHSPYHRHHPSRLRRSYHRLVDHARQSLYQPWEYFTRSNPRDLVIADVLTKEGSLYSGFLQSWIPDGNEIQGLSLRFVLRFFASQDASPARRKALIPNNGELFLPRSEIVSIHLWKIRRATELRVSVESEADLARTKWAVLLAYVFSEFISKVSVHSRLTESGTAQIALSLSEWMDEEEIVLSDDCIAFFFPAGESASPPGSDSRSGVLSDASDLQESPEPDVGT